MTQTVAQCTISRVLADVNMPCCCIWAMQHGSVVSLCNPNNDLIWWVSCSSSAESFFFSVQQPELCNWKAKCSARMHADIIINALMLRWGLHVVGKRVWYPKQLHTFSQAAQHEHRDRQGSSVFNVVIVFMSSLCREAFLEQYHWVPRLSIVMAETHRDLLLGVCWLCMKKLCCARQGWGSALVGWEGAGVIEK